MIRNRFVQTILTLFSCICSTQIHGQSDVNRFENIFQLSNNQWLCRELINSYPDYFARPHPEIHHPLHGPVEILTIQLSDSLIQTCDAILFPENNVKRFLLLKSLSDLYFPLIEKKLAANGLPEEFKYLPLVLSGLNQHYDVAGYKAGMWSLSYLSARRGHLRVDALVDERRGADFTTDIATKYLRELYDSCDRDIIKTLIAYDRGLPYLNRYNTGSNKIQLTDLEDEALLFVSLFIYTTKLFESVQTENQLQHYFDILGNYESIFTTQDCDLFAFREVLKVDLVNFHESNPVYTGDRIEGNYRKVPFVLKTSEAALFRAMEDSIYRWKPAVPLVVEEQWVENRSYYKVKRGDSLGKIAEKHNVTVKQIKNWNGLRKDRINEGQRLLIIQKKRKVVQQVQESNEPSTSVQPKEEVKGSYPPAKTDYIQHRVKSGESLWLIAKKYKGTTPEMIMKWNNCNENIRPGQILKIYAEPNK